jgi:hypothetical protein
MDQSHFHGHLWCWLKMNTNFSLFGKTWYTIESPKLWRTKQMSSCLILARLRLICDLHVTASARQSSYLLDCASYITRESLPLESRSTLRMQSQFSYMIHRYECASSLVQVTLCRLLRSDTLKNFWCTANSLNCNSEYYGASNSVLDNTI